MILWNMVKFQNTQVIFLEIRQLKQLQITSKEHFSLVFYCHTLHNPQLYRKVQKSSQLNERISVILSTPSSNRQNIQP